jgi:hypothetical protein
MFLSGTIFAEQHGSCSVKDRIQEKPFYHELLSGSLFNLKNGGPNE